jgi:hypothetical protein
MRRGAILCVVFVFAGGAAGCGAPQKTVAVVDPAAEVTVALSDAVKLIRAGRFDDAERRLAASRAVAAADPNELEKLDYYIATVMAYRGETARALQLIRAHSVSAASRGDVDSEGWMQSCSAWLRWAAQDHAGAVAENERIADLAGGLADAMDRRALLLSQKWDRAFFLLEQAQTADEADRGALLGRAREARDDYEALARDRDERDQIRLLGAYFAWRDGDPEKAAQTLAGVSVEQNDDVRALYVLSVVLDAAGQTETAARARSRLRSAVNLLAPLMERALERIRSARPL